MATNNKRVMLSLSNTRCSYCSRVIEQKLKKVPGIADISVNYLMDKVLVKYNPNKITIDEIRGSIKKLGYDSIERQ
jgi:copper chaperone CopZ